jgi:hypothetical protein
MIRRLPLYGRFISGLGGFLKTPISYESACATIRTRMERRNHNFLCMVKRCVYGNPGSPYLPLLRDARCEYGDMAAHLATQDLESLLTRLMDAGVWISLDEFKGRAPIRRNEKLYEVQDTDFDNPMVSQGWEFRTGGSTGRPSRALIDLEFLADRSVYEPIMFRMLDLFEVPMALWYPKLPASIGLSNSLRYAKVGKALDRWFDMKLEGRALPVWHSWAFWAIVRMSRFGKISIPWPEPAPLADPGNILDWISATVRRHGRCAFQSNVSGIVRLCRAATERGIDLKGVQFITGSEPLTPSKHAAIQAAHARVFQRYYAVDFGSIAVGCGTAEEIDELHLLSDTIALVSPPGEDGDGSRPLRLTSILGRGPRVAINVDLGDQANVYQRSCGCPYEALGFHTHLARVRSTTRSTAEGIALQYSELSRIAEEVLPRFLQGSVLDFQWVEDEEPEAGALTRLWLRIAPRLGVIDEEWVKRCILAEIGRRDDAHRFYAQLLGNAGTLKILRENPRTTFAGKTPVVMKGRSSGVAIGSEASGGA